MTAWQTRSAAEREAERRWPGIGRGAERAALDRAMRGGFEAGAEWQAERDAERIAELEAEVEQWRRVAVEQTRLERDRAEAAEGRLDAVRALHQPIELIHADAPAFPHRTLVCTECGTDKGQWPCATIRAIEGDKT